MLLTSTLFAQQKTVIGVITDSSSSAPLANVEVSNLTTNKKTTSDSRGNFSIGVSINDVLFFTKDGYRFKTFSYSLLMDATLDVRMSVLPHNLPGVTVQSDYTKYQRDSVKRRNEFNQDMVSPKYKTIQNNSNGAGAVINIDHFSKREKNKRNAEKLFKEQEENAYVQYRFSPELVSSYTGLKGDSLEKFRNLYWPDYNWLRKHPTDEDVFYYINEKIGEFYRRKK